MRTHIPALAQDLDEVEVVQRNGFSLPGPHAVIAGTQRGEAESAPAQREQGVHRVHAAVGPALRERAARQLDAANVYLHLQENG